jgi:hypothetical protein
LPTVRPRSPPTAFDSSAASTFTHHPAYSGARPVAVVRGVDADADADSKIRRGSPPPPSASKRSRMGLPSAASTFVQH